MNPSYSCEVPYSRYFLKGRDCTYTACSFEALTPGFEGGRARHVGTWLSQGTKLSNQLNKFTQNQLSILIHVGVLLSAACFDPAGSLVRHGKERLVGFPCASQIHFAHRESWSHFRYARQTKRVLETNNQGFSKTESGSKRNQIIKPFIGVMRTYPFLGGESTLVVGF